jgi:hypothetical protein
MQLLNESSLFLGFQGLKTFCSAESTLIVGGKPLISYWRSDFKLGVKIRLILGVRDNDL